MVRIIFACTISALIASVLAAPAKAQLSQLVPQTSVVLSGEGTASAAPDYAQITSGVITKAKTTKEATAANSKLMAAVTATLIDAGIAQKDIQTARFSIQPVYTQQGPYTERKLSGFSASNQITIKVRQIEKVSDLIDRMVTAGVTDIGNLVFLHSNTSKLLDQAREAALVDAKRKAELYARSSGHELGPVVWVVDQSVYTPPFRMSADRAMMAAPIAAGEDELRVNITVGFDFAH